MKMKTGLRYLLVQKVGKKQTKYSMDFQQEEALKCLLVTVPGVPILECLETNSVLNGWWILTQNITEKLTDKKQRTPTWFGKSRADSFQMPCLRQSVNRHWQGGQTVLNFTATG